LDADLLDGVQGADYARISAANAFIANQTIISTTPRLLLNKSNEGTDAKIFDATLGSGGLLTFRTRTDADGAGINVLQLQRTGGLLIGRTGLPLGLSSADFLFANGGSGNFVVAAQDAFTSFAFERYNGSMTGSPTEILNAQPLGFLSFGAYSSTAATLRGPVFFGATATENWSATACGTSLSFTTTANGTVTGDATLVLQGTQAKVADGTAAAPPVTFITDPDSGGPHRIGTNHIGFGTNATLALGIDASQHIYGKALHNNASSPTGTSLQFIASGTYTPTLTNTTNVAASTAFQCQWMRVGNVVTVSGRVSVDPTAAGATVLGISLPLASNIGAVEDCAGTAFANAVAGQGAAIWGDATNDRASMEWVAVDLTNQGMSFTFTYEII